MSAVVYDVTLVPNVRSPVEFITSVSYSPSNHSEDIGIIESPLFNWILTKEKLKRTTGQEDAKNEMREKLRILETNTAFDFS